MNRKVIFLDRDGILNIERGEYTFKEEDVRLVPDLMEALALFSSNGYEFIIISNQGGIAKGIYSKLDVVNVENILRSSLVEKGIKILDSYYCPHHNAIENCLCRKPKSLMLEKAVARHKVTKENSYFIGDSERDKIAGESIGIKSYQVEANSSILELSKKLIHE